MKSYGQAFYVNIEDATTENDNFRKVLFTSGKTQLVVMSLTSGQDIGLEVHKNNDQFIRIESGIGIANIGRTEKESNETYNLTAGSAIIIPAGTWHNIKNTGSDNLKLYTIYSPPEHKDKLIQKDKPIQKDTQKDTQKGGSKSRNTDRNRDIYKKYKKYKLKYLSTKTENTVAPHK